MIFNKTCKLVSETEIQDDIGQTITTPIYRKVFCGMKSVPQNEYFLCGQSNIRATFVLEVRTADYHAENKLMYNNKIYHIYRTHDKQNEFTDLYCEYRNGDNNG